MALAQYPDREALVGRHARYSYAELERVANRAAHALRSLGVKPGDRVAATLGNHTELVVAFLAAMRIGAIWVGVTRALAPAEKSFLVADSGACILLGDREACVQLGEIQGALPELKRIVEVEPGSATSEWSALLADAPDETRPGVEIDVFGPAAIAYTGGTTGLPKGVIHSQHNLLVPGAIAVAEGSAGREITQGVCLPLTILNLMILGPVQCALAGSKCVLLDRIDALGVAEWVRLEKIVALTSVPATFHDLLTHPDVRPEDLASLTHPRMGGSSCPEELKRLFRQRFGYGVQVGYGLTEAPAAVARTDPREAVVPGSVGRALPHVELSIRDEEGRPLPHGATGEVCIGPRSEGSWAAVYTTMLGYWRRPEASAEALQDGVLHTGDVGYLDESGNLFLRDRKADLIIRGGANVYPAEVERVLQSDPRVAACAVLGIEDDRLGERVVAAVQLARGAAADEQELRDSCRASLARYKVPDRIVFVDDFPRSPMGKILKRELGALFGRAKRESR